MPFEKIKSGTKKGKYRSPSGRVFTVRQVRLYYATAGFKSSMPGSKHPGARQPRR